MHSDTKQIVLPSLVSDVLVDRGHRIDNLFADTWKALKLESKIERAGLTKRSGIDIAHSVCLLLMWKWINVPSIAFFCRESLQQFVSAGKDVLYDLLKREDVNWRGLNWQVAKAVYREPAMSAGRIKAFVLDDSIKIRRGRKMEGVSCHFDHTSGRHVIGQQVLTLGLTTENAFIPLDSQIFISMDQVQPLNRPHRDGRSVVGQRYREATTLSKPEMAVKMMERAIQHQCEADYLVADAWFGTKTMIRSAVDLGVCPIVRMKKNAMKYRVTADDGSHQLLDAKTLYTQAVKKRWLKARGLPWKVCSVQAELDVRTEKSQEPRWQKVQLLFVRALSELDEPRVGKKDWALFLTTDVTLGMSTMLEVYALRWSIEVYFKEAKQHLGFLAEQTNTFASYTASIHLCAIRYLMLVHAKLQYPDWRVGDARDHIKGQLNKLTLASQLWGSFRTVIEIVLVRCQSQLKCSAETLLQDIDGEVREFLIRSLQLDALTLRLEHDCTVAT